MYLYQGTIVFKSRVERLKGFGTPKGISSILIYLAFCAFAADLEQHKSSISLGFYGREAGLIVGIIFAQ